MKKNQIAELTSLLEVQEKLFGPVCPQVATTRSQIAELHLDLGECQQAESFYRKALEVFEHLGSPYVSDVDRTKQMLNKLSERLNGSRLRGEDIRRAQAPEASESPPDFLKISGGNPALTKESIQKDAAANLRPIGVAHPDAPPKAPVKRAMSDDAITDMLIELDLLRQSVGQDHATIADGLTKLADIYCRYKMFDKMEPVLVEALAIREKQLGPDHIQTSTALKNLAMCYCAQDMHKLAEPLMERAIRIREDVLGPSDQKTVEIKSLYRQILGRVRI